MKLWEHGSCEDKVGRPVLGLSVDISDVVGIAQVILTVYRKSLQARPLHVNTPGIEMYDRWALTVKVAEVLSMACG